MIHSRFSRADRDLKLRSSIERNPRFGDLQDAASPTLGDEDSVPASFQVGDQRIDDEPVAANGADSLKNFVIGGGIS